MNNWKKIEVGDAWDFEENDTLIGVFVGKEENVGENQSMLYEIETKDGRRVNVWGSTILDTRLKNIEIGEEVKIVFLGREKSKKRKDTEYKNYDVFHRPRPMEKVEGEDE